MNRYPDIAVEALRRASRNTKHHSLTPFIGIVVFAVIGLTLLFGSQFAIHHHNVTHTNCVVIGKDRSYGGKGDSQMRVYTDHCGTFKVADITTRGRFNSADVYGGIVIGKTYDITAMGYRIPLISEFPNIVTITAH